MSPYCSLPSSVKRYRGEDASSTSATARSLGTSVSRLPDTLILKCVSPYAATASARAWGSPSATRSSGGTWCARSGSPRPTVCRATTAARGSGSQSAGRLPCSSGWISPSSTPRRLSCTARTNVVPLPWQKASSAARSTRLVPRWARSGGISWRPAQSACSACSRRQSANTESWACPVASSAACRMTRTIAGRSSSKRVSGSLVNHFGGNPSDARPAHATPWTEPRRITNTCGNSVMDAIP